MASLGGGWRTWQLGHRVDGGQVAGADNFSGGRADSHACATDPDYDPDPTHTHTLALGVH